MSYKTIRTKKGIELRYNVVMEEKLGRILKSGEIVHHIDQVKTNDSSNNLYLCECRKIHSSIHSQFYKLVYKFGKELLKEDIIKFDRKKGIYFFTTNLNLIIMNQIIEKVNLKEKKIEEILQRRKKIIKKTQKPRNNYLYNLEVKRLFDKMEEIELKFII